MTRLVTAFQSEATGATVYSRDFWIGMLIALPIVYPVQPVVPFAIAAYVLLLVRMNPSCGQVFGVLLLAGLGILSSLLSPYAVEIGLPRATYTALGYSMYLCGTGVRDRRQLYLGFTWSMRAFATATIVAFFVLGVYHAGWRLYQEGPIRGWAIALFPGWPNYFAFFLGVALLMEVFWWRRIFWSLTVIAAIVMTGSRTGLLALGICGLGLAIQGLRNRRARWPLVIALAVVGWLVVARVGGLVLFAAQHHHVATRLARANDRMAIYRYAWGIFATHPTIGVGDIVLNRDFGAPGSAFHNSYLEMLVREGLLGFGLWVFLLWPRSTWQRMDRRWAFLGLFLVAAIFNDIFRNPHAILLYAVLFLGRPESESSGDRSGEFVTS